MAEFVERGHIDKVVTSGNPVPRHHGKLDCHQPLQVLNTSMVTKEVAEILAPLETDEKPQLILSPRDRKNIVIKRNFIPLG